MLAVQLRMLGQLQRCVDPVSEMNERTCVFSLASFARKSKTILQIHLYPDG